MEKLKLENQICFPFYALSRLMTRAYQPFLDELEITYPQYLVLLVLWEEDHLPVNDIANKLILNTNTVTPLLKRMETQGLLKRKRSKEDERKVLVSLSAKGEKLKHKARLIPDKLLNCLKIGNLNPHHYHELKESLGSLISYLKEAEHC
jgi:DNA-binding MarR family transcriptional regulator